MLALGKPLLGVAGYVAGNLLLAWVLAKVEMWYGPRAGRPRPKDYWDD